MERNLDDKPTYDPNLLNGTQWTTFNPKGENASCTATTDLEELPTEVQTALSLVPCNFSNLGEIDVNWNVTCVSKDGTKVLRHAVFLDGGSRSGKGSCGENALWAQIDKNSKSKPLARGSTAFGYKGILYIIDGGLCPCARCCQSLLGLATRTESTIVVRPMVDYEMVSASRTELDRNQSFLLLFRPGATSFLVCHTAANEAPRSVVARDVTQHPTKVWCRCGKPPCVAQFTVRFPAENVKRQRVTANKSGVQGVEVKCPTCNQKSLAPLVTSAVGDFPVTVVDLYY